MFFEARHLSLGWASNKKPGGRTNCAADKSGQMVPSQLRRARNGLLDIIISGAQLCNSKWVSPSINIKVKSAGDVLPTREMEFFSRFLLSLRVLSLLSLF